MEIRLDYGCEGLTVDLPEPLTVVQPEHWRGIEDPAGAMADALRNPPVGPPLRDIARAGDKIAIAVCDVTRAQPRELMLTAVLSELDGTIRRADVTVILATGSHRPNTAEEIREMLGKELSSTLTVVNHDSRDRSGLVDLGEVERGLPVALDQRWVGADLRITTGFVEPHLFAGFSGGPKMVAPGLAGLETVMALHDAGRIADGRSTWGVIEGNPVQAGLRKAMALAPPHFGLDVTLNREREVTGIFAGEVLAEHRAACEIAKQVAMRPVDAPFDVVVTTNSGYPLDQNLYQSVKGMSAAARVVRPGGLVVCAAECRDGLPAGGFSELLSSGRTPKEVLERIESSPTTVPNQWQAQIQARILSHCRVGVYSEHLTASDLRSAHLDSVGDIASTVAEEMHAAGPGARLCVLPEGPQTIPYLAGAST